jgi:hypothetical protein
MASLMRTVALGVAASASTVAAGPARALLQIGDSPPPAWQFNIFDVDDDEVTVHPSDPFNPRYDVFRDWRLQHPCYANYLDSDIIQLASDSDSDSDSNSDSNSDAFVELCPEYPVGWPNPVRLVRQTMNVIRVLDADANGQYAVTAQGQSCEEVHGEGWAPAKFSTQGFEEQQPMVIQALDASVGKNVEVMSGVQSASGNCMMVRSVGEGTAVWEEQECDMSAQMATVCRMNVPDDGHEFVASADDDPSSISATVDITPGLFFAACIVCTALLARSQYKTWRNSQDADSTERQPLAPHSKESTGATEEAPAISL